MGIELVIAGQSVKNADDVVRKYLDRNERTIRGYDAKASETELTLDMVKATRKIASRISDASAEALVDIVNRVDWSAVPAGATLSDADPEEEGELYDAADEVYRAIWAQRPEKVGTGKLHKALHLLRPSLVPIVDSKIRGLYAGAAREVAAEVKKKREDFPYDATHWGAIRRDLERNAGALAEIERKTHDRVAELTGRDSGIGPLRVLDIVGWSVVKGRV